MYKHNSPISSAVRRVAVPVRPWFENSLGLYMGNDGHLHGLSQDILNPTDSVNYTSESTLTTDVTTDPSSATPAQSSQSSFFDSLINDLTGVVGTVTGATATGAANAITGALTPTPQTTTQRVVSTVTGAAKTIATSTNTYLLLGGAGLLAFLLLRRK